MDTAAARRVAVMTHPALEPEVCRSAGSSLWIGMTMVCVRAALSPPKQSATTATTGLGAVRACGTDEGVDNGTPGDRAVGRGYQIVAPSNQFLVGRAVSTRAGRARLPSTATGARAARGAGDG